MSGYQVTWTQALNETEGGRKQIEALIARVPHATIFNTPEWLECAARAVPSHRSLHVLSVRAGDRLVAYVPVTAGPERLHGVRVFSLRLLGHPLTDRVALLMLPDDATLPDVVLDSLKGCPAPWDVLVLSELYDAGERAQLARALATCRSIPSAWRACARSPVLRLGFDSVAGLRASYGRTLATRLRRARRKMAAAGEMRFERLLPAPEQVPPLVGLFKAIEDTSWKGREGLGIFSTPAGERFFTEVAMRIAARGWLDVGLLYLVGQPISYRFGFRYRNVFYDYNLAFDPAFAAYAPGRVLLDDMIISSLQEGLDAVDASRSGLVDPHLLADWTSEHVDHHELWLFRPTVRGRLMGWARRRLRPAVRRLRAGRRT